MTTNPIGWRSEFLVNTTTSGDQTRPKVTALANGGFVVVWEDASAGTGNKIDMTALASVGVHSMADLTITTVGGNDVITHGTDTITLTGFAGALTAANFIFA